MLLLISILIYSEYFHMTKIICAVSKHWVKLKLKLDHIYQVLGLGSWHWI